MRVWTERTALSYVLPESEVTDRYRTGVLEKACSNSLSTPKSVVVGKMAGESEWEACSALCLTCASRGERTERASAAERVRIRGDGKRGPGTLEETNFDALAVSWDATQTRWHGYGDQ